MEIWDAYDKDFRRIPHLSLIRGEPIPEGVFHLVCDVIVRHTDGSYLLMLRDKSKKHGGMWEATAGGSALQNESPRGMCRKRTPGRDGYCSRQPYRSRTVKKP